MAEQEIPTSLAGIEAVSAFAFGDPSRLKVVVVPNDSLLRIMPLRGQLDAAGAALKPLGFETLPSTGSFVDAEDRRLAWAGKNCWHLRSAADSEASVSTHLQGLAAVTSAGDGLLRLEIEGAQACTLMSKGCVLDLDGFLPGQAAVTLMAHTRVFLHRNAPTAFALTIPASHAASFWEWLLLSAEEFGEAARLKDG